VINLLKSIVTTIVVSTVATLLAIPFTSKLVIVFVITTISQFIIFYIIGSIMEYIGEIKLKEIEAFKLAEYSKQGMEVECPCHKKVKQFVPVILNTKNTYKCIDCSKINSVIISAETAQTTQPLE